MTELVAPPAESPPTTARRVALRGGWLTIILILAAGLRERHRGETLRAAVSPLPRPARPLLARPAWLRCPWEFPLPPQLLDRGIVAEGDPGPARRLAQKLLAGEPITAVTLGGSLTFGKGATTPGRSDWVSLFFTWLRQGFPAMAGSGGHALLNAAVAASPSEYISLCLQQHLPPGKTPDLVIVDYAVNDGLRPWHDAHRLSYERLLRRLLALPSRPLVVGLMLHSYRTAQTNGTFHRSGEEKLGTLMQYYGLPWLSMRGVVHHNLVAGEEGFRKSQWLADETHPNDRGHTYVAQLVIRYLQRVVAREADKQLLRRLLQSSSTVGRQAGDAGGGSAAIARLLQHQPGDSCGAGPSMAAALPPPMLPGAWSLVAEMCLQGATLQRAVVPGSMRGFEWEVGGKKEALEIHAYTDSPGSQLTVALNTDVQPAGGASVPAANATHVGVLLWFTHSRYMVGDGGASCSGGCACERQLLKTALRRPYGTQDHLWLMLVSRASDCRITVRTLNTTDTEGHIFRLRGVLVSAAAAVLAPAEFRLGENEEAELPVAV